MHRTWLIFALSWISIDLRAQTSDSTAREILPNVLLFEFMYGVQMPAGHMREDFLYNFMLGARVSWYTPSNWWLAAVADFHFLDNVRTDVVAPLRATPSRFIITENGALSDVVLGQRGMVIGGMVGRLLPFKPRKHKRWGIDIGLGAGYMQHWIRIRLLNSDIPPLTGDYKKGYDRMTSGFALQQYVGLRYMGKKRLFNVSVGFDFTQGFTQNRRPINFDTGIADTRKRIDVLMGLRAGIALPLYLHSAESLRNQEVPAY